MTEPLFTDGPERLPEPEPTTATERRRARQDTLIRAGLHPLTSSRLTLVLLGPERDGAGHTCGDCAHRAVQGGTAGRYTKCELGPLTRGPATDVLARWPACTRWAPEP